MHLYTLTIMEEGIKPGQEACELKLWENADGKIWIQVGYDDMDPSTQGIPITVDDAKVLIDELTRIIKNIETPIIETKKVEPVNNGQQLTLQKVAWNK